MKEDHGVVRVTAGRSSGFRPFVDPRLIKRGKNKGKFEITFTAGRGKGGKINRGAKLIVRRSDIVYFPEGGDYV